MRKNELNDVLCCCEYFNNENERSHLLGCCCNCVDLDLALDRLICCSGVPYSTIQNMLLTFQDRLRIPWRNGARQVSPDAILPPLILPFLALISLQSLYCTILVFLLLPIFLGYVYVILLRIMPKSQFFIMWFISSFVYFWIIFETEIVPMLEILPEENIIFIGFMFSALICLYKVRSHADKCHVPTNDVSILKSTEKELLIDTEITDVHLDDSQDALCNISVTSAPDIESSGSSRMQWICAVCHKKVPARTYHCKICQACVIQKDHHCVWLDCCIGQYNHRYFLAGLFLSLLALLYGSDLILTTVCHPFELYPGILLPDDCTDVYMDVEMALSFVTAIYALIMSIAVFALLFHQVYLISIGVTGAEYRNNIRHRGRTNCLTNWKEFICCRNSQNLTNCSDIK